MVLRSCSSFAMSSFWSAMVETVSVNCICKSVQRPGGGGEKKGTVTGTIEYGRRILGSHLVAAVPFLNIQHYLHHSRKQYRSHKDEDPLNRHNNIHSLTLSSNRLESQALDPGLCKGPDSVPIQAHLSHKINILCTRKSSMQGLQSLLQHNRILHARFCFQKCRGTFTILF